MMFIIREQSGRVPPVQIKMVRKTPAIVSGSAGCVDYFCLGDPKAATQAGWFVVPVRDGWYADDNGGGMAIWGHGMFWEVRDTPFSVKEACGPEAWQTGETADTDAPLNVRQAIFQG